MTRMAMAFRVACPNPSSLLDLLIAAIDADYPTDSQLGGLQPEMQLSHDLPLICICGSVSAPAADIVGSGSERNQAESRAPHCSHKQCLSSQVVGILPWWAAILSTQSSLLWDGTGTDGTIDVIDFAFVVHVVNNLAQSGPRPAFQLRLDTLKMLLLCLEPGGQPSDGAASHTVDNINSLVSVLSPLLPTSPPSTSLMVRKSQPAWQIYKE